jgi:hypothetical protein
MRLAPGPTATPAMLGIFTVSALTAVPSTIDGTRRDQTGDGSDATRPVSSNVSASRTQRSPQAWRNLLAMSRTLRLVAEGLQDRGPGLETWRQERGGVDHPGEFASVEVLSPHPLPADGFARK